MPEITRRAPAKLNLTLEIVGDRADGYHELRSVVTGLDLCDSLTVSDGQGFVVLAEEDYDPTELPDGREALNSVETALALAVVQRTRHALAGAKLKPACMPASPNLEAALRQGLSEVHIRLHKRIPASAGLGGGSSDGTAALVALNAYWGLGLESEDL